MLLTVVFQIRSLPNLAVVFSTSTLGLLPAIISHSSDATMEDEASKTESPGVDQICIAGIGEVGQAKPYLLVSPMARQLALS